MRQDDTGGRTLTLTHTSTPTTLTLTILTLTLNPDHLTQTNRGRRPAHPTRNQVPQFPPYP